MMGEKVVLLLFLMDESVHLLDCLYMTQDETLKIFSNRWRSCLLFLQQICTDPHPAPYVGELEPGRGPAVPAAAAKGRQAGSQRVFQDLQGGHGPNFPLSGQVSPLLLLAVSIPVTFSSFFPFKLETLSKDCLRQMSEEQSRGQKHNSNCA